MATCKGIHCDGCGKGGITAGGIVAVIFACVVLANWHAASHAASDVGHVLMIILEVIAGTLAAGAAVVLTYGSYRAARAIQASAWYQARAAGRTAVQASSGPPVLYGVKIAPEIEPARVSLPDGSWHQGQVTGTVEK